jgi:hypothetical protein
MVATETTTSNSTTAQQDIGGPRNVEPDLSELFTCRGAARGVSHNLHDPLSELLRRATYLPGV